MSKIENEVDFLEPKYYIREFVYMDFTRSQARHLISYWSDDSSVERYQFGESFEVVLYEPEHWVGELTVANRPALKIVNYPEDKGDTIQILDVFFAPTEQWMLYKDASEEEINREPDINR